MATPGLEQLRDIHLPAAPSLWPPAPGWWLLALLVVLALSWLAWRVRARQRRLLPLRHAARLYDDVHQRFRAGTLSRHGYLDACNELLKRVLIHGLGRNDARRASGMRWLALLDDALGSGEPAFVSGPGRVLGDARFRPGEVEDMDPTAFDDLMRRLLGTLTVDPPRGRSGLPGEPAGARADTGAAS